MFTHQYHLCYLLDPPQPCIPSRQLVESQLWIACHEHVEVMQHVASRTVLHLPCPGPFFCCTSSQVSPRTSTRWRIVAWRSVVAGSNLVWRLVLSSPFTRTFDKAMGSSDCKPCSCTWMVMLLHSWSKDNRLLQHYTLRLIILMFWTPARMVWALVFPWRVCARRPPHAIFTATKLVTNKISKQFNHHQLRYHKKQDNTNKKASSN